MTKLSVEDLVRATVARAARGRSLTQIADTATLRELGYSDADTEELRLRLVKAVSPRRSTDLTLARASPITPDATVEAVIEDVREILPARAGRTRGGAASPHPAQVAVIAALAEVSPKLDFSQIELTMKLRRDLGLDVAALAEVKIAISRMLSGKQLVNTFSILEVSPSSTVGDLIEHVRGVLPGNVTTGRKGIVRTGRSRGVRLQPKSVAGRGTRDSAPPAASRGKGVAGRGTSDYAPPAASRGKGVAGRGTRDHAPPAASLAGDTNTGKKG